MSEARDQVMATARWSRPQVCLYCLRSLWTTDSQGHRPDLRLGTCTDLFWWHHQGWRPSTPWFHFSWAQPKHASLNSISGATSNLVYCNRCQALHCCPPTSLEGIVLCFSLLARMLRCSSRRLIRRMDPTQVTLKTWPRRKAHFGDGILCCMALDCLEDQDLGYK